MRDWKEQLREIRDGKTTAEQRRDEESRASSGNPRSRREQPPVTISLGLDFGTSFTKAVWRNLATDEAGAVALPRVFSDSPFPPSRVYLSGDRKCLAPWDSGDANCKSLLFLKMHLTGRQIGPPPHEITQIESVSDHDLTFALSVFYVARVFLEARLNTKEQLRDVITDRRVEWVSCLGVPDAQYDSDHKQTFEELGKLAWSLSLAMDAGRISTTPTVEELLKVVMELRGSHDESKQPVEIYPELGAAVLSFLVSPQARPGVYFYFDIGGGTFDGVAFRFWQRDENRYVEYYSACVEPLGIEMAAEQIKRKLRENLKRKNVMSAFRAGEEELVLELPTQSVRNELQTAVAQVVMDAKNCHGSDWIKGNDQRELAEWLRRAAGYTTGREELIMFEGGGGTFSCHHRRWIEGTHSARNHAQCGIPPYHLQKIPKPNGFHVPLQPEPDHGRLAVAYGLSASITTAIGIAGLPSHATYKEAKKAHIDFDDRCRELYGETN